MSTVARRDVGLKTTVATLYADNCNLFKIIVKIANGTAVDLRAEDDAVDEAVEFIVKELNPLAYFIVDASTGIINVVMDKNANSADDLQTRIRNMGVVGVNSVNVTGTTVAVGTLLTVA